MEIITGDHSEGYWFVPDFGNNRESTTPARVRVLPISGKEKLRIEHTTGLKTKADKKSDVVTTFARREWSKQKRILEDRIVELEHWTKRDIKTGEVVELKTGKDLVDALLSAQSSKMMEILDQIYEVILDASTLQDQTLGE